MMNMKKNLFLMIVAMMTLVMVGCGKTEEPIEKENTVVTTTVEEEPVVEPEVEKAWWLDEENYIQWTNDEDFVNSDGVNFFPKKVTISVPFLEGVTTLEESRNEKGVADTFVTAFDEKSCIELVISTFEANEKEIRNVYADYKDSEIFDIEEIGTSFVFFHPKEGYQEKGYSGDAIWKYDELYICDIANMKSMIILFYPRDGADALEGAYGMRDRMIQEIRASLQANEEITPKAQTEANDEEIRTELTEATQHQISAFIGSINNYYIEEPFPSSTTNAEDCLVLLKYYLNDCGFDFQEGNKDDLPFAWKEYHINRAEFDLFFEKGWGIEIPEDFSYTAFNDYIPELPYGVLIPEEGGWESNVDGSLYLSGGRTVEIEGYADGVYTLKGTFINGASDDDSLTQKTFTATAIESGDPQIYDGLQITGFEVVE